MGDKVVLRALPKSQRRPAIPRHLLALSGGGFRGLFTARVLEFMEARCGAGLSSRFDMIAGTSIGGIIAIGLCCGLPARDMRRKIQAQGPRIFRRRKRSLGGLLGSAYDPATLGEAICEILGRQRSEMLFRDIPAALTVVAIDERDSRPRLFRTEACAPGLGDEVKVIDVALATSAAPTYFPAHIIGDRPYVDGGLVANSPDLVLVQEAARRFASPISDLNLCSVGTASTPRSGQATGRHGKIGWIVNHKLVELTMDSQSALTAQQIDRLGIGTILRIDARPGSPIELDDVGKKTSIRLRRLASEAVHRARTGRRADWRKFLAHRAGPPDPPLP
jgi:predicted acylesterase/phospholipase RssA